MIEQSYTKAVNILDKYNLVLKQVDTLRPAGRVEEVAGLAIYSKGPEVKIGEICRVENSEDESYLQCEVVGFHNSRIVLMPLGVLKGVFPGARVLANGKPQTIGVSENLLGRVLDGTGVPLDGKEVIIAPELRPIEASPPNPNNRPLIKKVLSTGIKAIDTFLSVGRGQRIGIFAGSGVGKSTIMGMIARYTEADVNVIALVGERGKEVREFIEYELGKDGLKKSVVIVATSDRPAMEKVSAAMVATTIAEYFRDQGKNVNLMMDSVTRFAMAQREIGASIRETVITKGYPASVFSKLSRLVERSGTSEKGTITGFYTVLVDADDMNEPVSDAVRGYLDGHIVLSRKLASSNHYPAIDILESVSRSMPKVVSSKHMEMANEIKKSMYIFRENEDFIKVGAYTVGADPSVDFSIELNKIIMPFLKQKVEEKGNFQDSLEELYNIWKQFVPEEESY